MTSGSNYTVPSHFGGGSEKVGIYGCPRFRGRGMLLSRQFHNKFFLPLIHRQEHAKRKKALSSIYVSMFFQVHGQWENVQLRKCLRRCRRLINI